MSTLLSNADCGPVNALNQLQKHADVDRSLQRDRTAGPSTSRLTHFPLTSVPARPSSSQSAASRFFEDAPLPTALSLPRNEQSTSTIVRSQWAQEFPQQALSAHMDSNARMRSEMEVALRRAQNHVPTSISNTGFLPSSWVSEFQPASASYVSHSATMHHPPAHITEIPPSMWEQEFARIDNHPPVIDHTGKGRAHEFSDAALEEAFARVAVETEEKADLDNPPARDFSAEFETVWTQINQDNQKVSDGDLASWEAEFHAARLEEENDPEWDLSEMERRYQELTAAARDMDDSGFTVRFDEDGLPDLGDYEFEQDNPYLAGYMPDALTALLQESLASSDPSALTRSALILEAMIQLQGPQSSQFQLWYTLGQVLVRDERDDKGIRALVRAVRESAGQSEGNSAILELAIAYVNQSYDMACFLTLSKFLRSAHPSLPNLPDTEALKGQALWSVRDVVKDAFLSLAREQHAGSVVDPDIQMGLGVLLYSEAEYDRAAECFQAALSINPQNAVLWNRLGSCLSNGNRPEEAIGSYQRALEIWPNYTRAVVNIGVACLNMGAHKEAVEHFLSAIAMHDGSGSGPSTAIPRGVKSNEDIWKTLRRTFLAMDRHDLAERALAPDRSAEAFRGEGFEF